MCQEGSHWLINRFMPMIYKLLSRPVLLLLGITALLSSCGSENSLVVSRVGYQSVRTSFAQPKEIPDDAKIAVQYFFNPSGEMMVVVFNRTDKILTIDQTKSFLINTTGTSQSYFDPATYTTTSGSFNSETHGTSFNLGAIANAFGIGGAIGSMLSGLTTTNSTTIGTYGSSSVSVQDQPLVRVGPHGNMIMSKQFKITGLTDGLATDSYVDTGFQSAPLRFSVCVSYSFEEAPDEKLVTDFYVNTTINEPVSGGRVNDAFTKIYRQKPDAVAEYAYTMRVFTNLPQKTNDSSWNGEVITTNNIFDRFAHGSLIDYK